MVSWQLILSGFLDIIRKHKQQKNILDPIKIITPSKDTIKKVKATQNMKIFILFKIFINHI